MSRSTHQHIDLCSRRTQEKQALIEKASWPPCGDALLVPDFNQGTQRLVLLLGSARRCLWALYPWLAIRLAMYRDHAGLCPRPSQPQWPKMQKRAQRNIFSVFHRVFDCVLSSLLAIGAPGNPLSDSFRTSGGRLNDVNGQEYRNPGQKWDLVVKLLEQH